MSFSQPTGGKHAFTENITLKQVFFVQVSETSIDEKFFGKKKEETIFNFRNKVTEISALQLKQNLVWPLNFLREFKK
jgi:hypothetical protein